MNLYRLVIENRAAKEVDALQEEMLERVVKAISFLKQNPRPHGVKKLFMDDGWRIRVGDYRILYTIDDKQKVVTVYRVKHRKEAYR